MADGSTFDASSGGASRRRRSFYRQVAILERWRVTACPQAFASFLLSNDCYVRRSAVPLENACSQHVVVLTTFCEWRRSRRNRLARRSCGAMRESGIFFGSPLAPPANFRGRPKLGLVEPHITSHADVCPY